ncbi:hypothetical protein ACA910_000972 [Epithemia clementina (nom. ined.)]
MKPISMPLSTILLLALFYWAVDSFPVVQPLPVSKHESRQAAVAQHQHKAAVVDREFLVQKRPQIDITQQVEQLLEENKNSIVVTQQQQTNDGRKKAKVVLSDLLVLGSGAANVVTFKTFGFYASMMTGNIMRLCMSLVDLRLGDAVFFASTVMSYTAGAAFFRFLTIRHERSWHKCRRRLFGQVSLTVLLMFAIADLLGHVLPVPERWMGLFLGLGFGFVNAVSVEETSVITWAATGHINKIAMGIIDGLLLGEKKPKAFDGNVRVVVIFMLSVVLSAALWKTLAPLPAVSRLRPPVGTFIGLFYAALFGGYGLHIGKRQPAVQLAASRASSSWEPVFSWSPFNGTCLKEDSRTANVAFAPQ